MNCHMIATVTIQVCTSASSVPSAPHPHGHKLSLVALILVIWTCERIFKLAFHLLFLMTKGVVIYVSVSQQFEGQQLRIIWLYLYPTLLDYSVC